MTIYAIINRLLPSEMRVEEPVWSVISASAMLQGGNPYFVPDFAGRFEARIAIAIKIGKLGKSVAPRFAHRYVEAVAPAAVMVATDLLNSLQQAKLPWSKAISYDRSVAIGNFIKIPFEELPSSNVNLILSHDCIPPLSLEWKLSQLGNAVEEAICSISNDNTLKTGDIILAGIENSGPLLKPGQKASLAINGIETMKFNIR